MITLAQLFIALICIIGKTKPLLHQIVLIKLMRLSGIMKNIQAFVILKQNIEVLVISHFGQFLLRKSKRSFDILRLTKLSVVKYRLRYEMPTKILKECEFAFDVLTKCINKSVETGYFPDSLKLANVAPVFKKEDRLDKSNYRPVSILPLLSKVYEKVIYNQLPDYSDNFLNNILCGF